MSEMPSHLFALLGGQVGATPREDALAGQSLFRIKDRDKLFILAQSKWQLDRFAHSRNCRGRRFIEPVGGGLSIPQGCAVSATGFVPEGTEGQANNAPILPAAAPGHEGESWSVQRMTGLARWLVSILAGVREQYDGRIAICNAN